MNIESLYQIYLQHPAVSTDTRKIEAGAVFFALKGPSFNGNAFAEKAIALGAAYAVVDEVQYRLDERFILVDDVLTALQQLARHHRQQLPIPFIAITGSNGKTTSKELVTAVLAQKFITYATEGNLNNHIGVPLTILKIKQDAEMAVIEMGANHQKEIAAYCSVALPDYGIINNCGKAHLEGFGGIEGVRKGKGELYDFIRENKGTIFRNADLEYLQEMAAGIEKQITYGSTDATYTGQISGHQMTLNVAVQAPGFSVAVHSQLVGDYNFPNIMLAVAVGAHFGVSKEQIKAAIENYLPDNSRSQLVERGTNRVILDAYNANPTSMRAAISNFAGLEGDNKILWLGAMKEMGQEEAFEHQALVGFIGQWSWKEVILVGQEYEPCKGDLSWFADSDAAAGYLSAHKPAHSLILVKGSRGSKMEKLLEAL
ncbi:MAG: UDP-N-acetylmuramoyl-tripeptide--D-alanyl-D-alanine ligase [Chitinophagaceae bacterium]|nr:UDP-N-acetylmuramoyl-tripeptide--D-alanyl-D-alanine ligase [Chitinophagaceae bacterium]